MAFLEILSGTVVFPHSAFAQYDSESWKEGIDGQCPQHGYALYVIEQHPTAWKELKAENLMKDIAPCWPKVVNGNLKAVQQVLRFQSTALRGIPCLPTMVKI